MYKREQRILYQIDGAIVKRVWLPMRFAIVCKFIVFTRRVWIEIKIKIKNNLEFQIVRKTFARIVSCVVLLVLPDESVVCRLARVRKLTASREPF